MTARGSGGPRAESSESANRRLWWRAGLALAGVGVLVRANNALQYPINLGFDAQENWRYIHRVMHDWALPTPSADWATSHPPFYYYVSATLGRMTGLHEADPVAIYIRLLSTAAGLLAIGLAVMLVARVAPERPRRAWLAGALLTFLPVHIYMSAMLTEEILTSALVSIVVTGTALELSRTDRGGAPSGASARGARWRAAGLGLVGGLALLTKLSGCLVVAASATAYAIAGWREGRLVPALLWSSILAGVALVVGGWFYVHNLLTYGYIYPQDLQLHEVMFTMPPGERSIVDYLYVPLATFRDPQLLDPDLLHSVWGSTYVTLWFDGHRHYLARESVAVTRGGTLILTLALLPTAAFFAGAARGVRRAFARAAGPDSPLLWLVALTGAGYVFFTWGNPWFAAVKGSYLLGLSVPFAFYASEMLDEWVDGPTLRRAIVWSALASLALAVLAVFTYGPLYWNWAGRGIEWVPVEAP